MNLIIEGVDNVGKSTLIKNLNKYFYNSIIHNLHYTSLKFTNTEDTFERSYKLYKDMFEIISDENRNFILDRSYIDEFVYGPKYRNYQQKHIDLLKKLELKYKNILKNNTIVIYLYDDIENILKRDDGLSISIDIKDIKEEIQLFQNTISSSIYKYIFISVKENSDLTFQDILYKLKEMNIDVKNNKLQFL